VRARRFSAQSDRSFDTGVATDGLRRLPEGAQESAAHALAIGKPGVTRDDVNRMPTFFHHQTRCFDPQVLNCFGRGLTGLRAEDATELPRAQMCRLGKLVD
jgi:hypothetical protein